jgi:hypothetical protein
MTKYKRKSNSHLKQKENNGKEQDIKRRKISRESTDEKKNHEPKGKMNNNLETLVNKSENETFPLLETKVYVKHLIINQKSYQKIEQKAQKFIKQQKKCSQLKKEGEFSEEEEEEEEEGSDSDLDELVDLVSKFPIAFGTQLSEQCPFSRFIFYKKHYGELKDNSRQFTSFFNQQLLDSSSVKKEQDPIVNPIEDASLKELIKERSKDLTLFMTNVHYNETPEQISQFFKHNFQATTNECLFSDFYKQQQQALGKGEETIVLNSIIDRPFSDVKTNHFLSSGTVHVVLNETSKMKQALLAPEMNILNPKKPFIENSESVSSASGLQRYLNEYKSNLIAHNQVSSAIQEINKWMINFDRAEKHEEELIEALRNQKDENGWTKVVAPKGKRHLLPLHKDDILQRNANAKRPKKFRDQVVMPFYKYQRAELKKKEVEMLRERFEQDKKLIEKMKQNKQFKPF